MNRLREVWRSCIRDNVEAGDSYFCIESGYWLLASGVWSVGVIGRFRSFEGEASWAVDKSLNCIKEELRRASKDSITKIKPMERSREEVRLLAAEKEMFCRTEPIRLIFWKRISLLTEFVYLFFQLCKMTPSLRAALENGMSLWSTRSEEGRSLLRAESPE